MPRPRKKTMKPKDKAQGFSPDERISEGSSLPEKKAAYVPLTEEGPLLLAEAPAVEGDPTPPAPPQPEKADDSFIQRTIIGNPRTPINKLPWSVLSAEMAQARRGREDREGHSANEYTESGGLLRVNYLKNGGGR